jgi:hypothetical protein
MKSTVSSSSGFNREEGTINLSVRNGREDIEFGGITFVFQDCVRIACARITAAITEIDPNMLESLGRT